MEVYTPIPEEAIRRAPRSIRIAGWVLLMAALAYVAVPVVRYAFNIGMPPDFHNYGTVETRFGTAGVWCGGEGPPCGDATGIELPTCTSYFNNDVGAPDTTAFVDERVRDLLGKRPPSGDQWVVACGNPAMIRGAPAKLDDN